MNETRLLARARAAAEAEPPAVSPSRGTLGFKGWLTIVLLAVGASCGDAVTPPDTLRYGQVGSIRVTVDAPLRTGAGRLRQTLSWNSSGSWSLREGIFFNGVLGDEDFRKNPGDPSQYASAYAGLITQFNEVEGQELFGIVPDTIIPQCGPDRSKITLTIEDEPRGEQTTWIRCADGSLSNLTPANAGPDPEASRVALATLLVRDNTVGEHFSSAYAGSVPFGTLDRGDDLKATLRQPTAITDPQVFKAFWTQASGGKAPPQVNFDSLMVIVAVVGEKGEAGDSVEVRRILQVEQGTLIEIWERVPGDYCSPAAKLHVPYHVVVAPRTPSPLNFSDVRVAYQSCGG